VFLSLNLPLLVNDDAQVEPSNRGERMECDHELLGLVETEGNTLKSVRTLRHQIEGFDVAIATKHRDLVPFPDVQEVDAPNLGKPGKVKDEDAPRRRPGGPPSRTRARARSRTQSWGPRLSGRNQEVPEGFAIFPGASHHAPPAPSESPALKVGRPEGKDVPVSHQSVAFHPGRVKDHRVEVVIPVVASRGNAHPVLVEPFPHDELAPLQGSPVGGPGKG